MDKKMAVFQILEDLGNPVTLTELMEKLGENFKERTVRRWLDEMAKKGIVSKTGQKRGTKYQITRRNYPSEKFFSSESLRALEYVKKPLYQRKPIAYNLNWLDSYQPNSTFYLPEDKREDLFDAGIRETNEDPAGTYARQIFNRLLIDLSYNSSRLEGNTYSYLDTEKLVLSGKSAEGKLDEEKVMILNHKEAIRYLVENAPKLKIDTETIFTLHYLLADGLVESKYAGKVRDHWVRITGSTYLPFDDQQKLKIQLEKIAKKGEQIEDPFEKSFFLLVHLSYLQAFSDVNKRTARLSANIPLIIENLVPLSFKDVEREDYLSAIIAIYELQDVHPMIDLFTFSYKRTCIAYDSTVKALGYDEIRVHYRPIRREIIRDVISRNLVGQKMKTFIKSKAKKDIPLKDQEEFIEDVLEDLELMDKSRCRGLGIPPQELEVWLSNYIKNKK